jgi:quinol monooxygenase YgiN
MVERWESADALRVHGKAEALTTLGGQLAGKLAAAPDVRRLTPVPAGDPD